MLNNKDNNKLITASFYSIVHDVATLKFVCHQLTDYKHLEVITST